MENFASPDNLIVLAFLVVTLVIGVRASRGVKRLEEYAVAKKVYGEVAILITILATFEGGSSTIGTAANVFADGIIMSVQQIISFPIVFLFIALFVTRMMRSFDDCISTGDIMHKFYGNGGRVVSGLVGTVYSILIITAQVMAMGYVCEVTLGIKGEAAMVLSGLVLVLYTARGGIKAVTNTDLLQFTLLLAAVPTLASTSVLQSGGIEHLFEKLPAEKLALFSHPKFSYYTVLCILTAFPTFLLSPPMIQRMLMAEDMGQLKKMFLHGAWITPVGAIMTMLIGASAYVLYPEIEAKAAFPYLVKTVVPTGVRGCMVVGMLAIIMSTADSFLNAAGIALTHDVLKPFCDKRGIKLEELTWARYLTALIGCAAISLALASENIIHLMMYASGILGSLTTVPLLAGILGFRADQLTFYTTLLLTTVVYISAKAVHIPTHWTLLATLIASLASFSSLYCIRRHWANESPA